MKVCFYLGHPAHFDLFKNLFADLDKNRIKYLVLIKSKDVLEKLMIENEIPYINIFDKKRKESVFSIFISLVIKDIRILKYVIKFKPNILMGTSIELAHVGYLLKIPSLIVNEDDYDVIPQFAKLGYPFATKIIAPNSCRLGKWEYKRIGYDGYHEHAYLNNSSFKPNIDIAKSYKKDTEAFSIFIRFSSLNAYHDKGKKGLSNYEIEKILTMFSGWNIFISSEADHDLGSYEFTRVKPNDVHDVLAYTDVFLGDSQTMTAEAALLGVVAIRYNDFVGQIGYLEELESVHQLTYGFDLSQKEALFEFLNYVRSNILQLHVEHKNRLSKTRENLDDLNKILMKSIYKYAK